jgi:DNA polymerase-3 subunit epsilon
VAHNVRFDYGFLTAEYARLERRFRYPTLCTCQSMRKLWKGLPSYGLANLSRHFGIPLESHHRALCDAEAAAGLLMKINERRFADGGGPGS